MQGAVLTAKVLVHIEAKRTAKAQTWETWKRIPQPARLEKDIHIYFPRQPKYSHTVIENLGECLSRIEGEKCFR